MLELAEDALAVFGVGQALDLVQFRLAGERPGVPADVGPFAEQLFAEGRDVDGGRLRGPGWAPERPAAVAAGRGCRRCVLRPGALRGGAVG